MNLFYLLKWPIKVGGRGERESSGIYCFGLVLNMAAALMEDLREFSRELVRDMFQSVWKQDLLTPSM